MRPPRVLLALSLFSLSCASARAYDASQRASMIEMLAVRVQAHGTFTPPSAPYAASYTIEDPETPDESADYTVHIAKLWGAAAGGNFWRQVVTVESRAWTRVPTGWKMEQWLFRVSLKGEIERIIRRDRLENLQHTNIFSQDSTEIPVSGPGSEAGQRVFDELLSHWNDWRPKSR
ncbi:MAG: hypothetical protein HY059_22240 [Proteobacteria bacterium]|nr:hypothetical protein [Pseudomonadota bacterium]